MKRFLFSIIIISVLILGIFIVKASADLNDGLVAYYPFNGNANDESGNGNHGTVHGATLTEDRFGNINNAYYFNNDPSLWTPANSYITIGDSPTLRPTSRITISAWIKTSNNNGRTILGKEYGSSTDDSYVLWYETNNSLGFYLRTDSSSSEHLWAPIPALNEWQHIAGVWDGLTMKLFVDNIKVNERQILGSIIYDSNPFYIGADDNNGNDIPDEGWDGFIDDVRIYNRVLSENEIQQLYNGPITITIPEDATEGDGVLEDQGIIGIFSAPGTDLAINLSSDDASLVTVPETVIILADQDTATFDVEVKDNCIDNASQYVTITASASCYISGSDVIQVADNDISVEMKLPSGWYMISLPVIPCNASVSSIFPEAKAVYGYEKCLGYLQVSANEDLEARKGYWILLDQNQRYTLTGEPMLSYTKTVYEPGWEMIGGSTYPVTVSTDGCNVGIIYDYVQGAGYRRVPGSEKIEPGKGYWMMFHDFSYVILPITRSWSDWNMDFGEIAEALRYPVVTSKLEPNIHPQGVITFFTVDIEGQRKSVSKDREPILLYDEMDPKQRTAYNNFDQLTKTKIALARLFFPSNPRNQNKLLFYDPNNPNFFYQNYDSLYLEEIDSSKYGKNWPFPEFDYREYRLPSGGGNIELPLIAGRTIIRPYMTVKRGKTLTLQEGLYFFESLTLEENSTLNTNGPVSIYVKRLELKENARLMGGRIDNPEIESPNNLIILAQCWPATSCSRENDGIHIGSAAKVYGHIFAPGLKVILCKGSSMNNDTRVYGSILTYHLVTSNCDAGVSPGPIWILYDEYIEKNFECNFELQVIN